VGFFAFGSIHVDALAQEVAVASMSEAKQATCGPALQLPKGTSVILSDGGLRVTLPVGYAVVRDELGEIVFALGAMSGLSGPWRDILQGEEVTLNCKCSDTDDGDDDPCRELYDIVNNTITCEYNECSDCAVVVEREDDE